TNKLDDAPTQAIDELYEITAHNQDKSQNKTRIQKCSMLCRDVIYHPQGVTYLLLKPSPNGSNLQQTSFGGGSKNYLSPVDSPLEQCTEINAPAPEQYI